MVRLRRKVFNPYSTLGVLATSRVGEDGVYNIAYGVDGSFRLFGNEYLTLKWSQTSDQDAKGFQPEASQSFLHWQRRSTTGFKYWIQLGRVGEAYNPGVGFVNQRAITTGSPVVAYNILTDDHRWLRSYQPSIVVIRTYRNGTGALDRSFIGPWIEFTTKRSHLTVPCVNE